MMPRVDGLQLLERVKNDPNHKDLPVLMISSMPPEEATVRSLGLGAADFISKPFRVRELLARVKAHLRVGRELNQARAEARTPFGDGGHPPGSHGLAQAGGDLSHPGAAGGAGPQHLQVLADRGRMPTTDDYALVVAAYENPDASQPARSISSAIPRSGGRSTPARWCWCTDVLTDPLYHEVRAEWEAEGRSVPTRSAIALPFTLRDQPAGVFFLRTTEEDPPLDHRDVDFADQVIRAAVAALEKAYDLENAVLGQEQMKQLAETDPLTETFNRRALNEKLAQEMERANRYSTVLACLMVDIDNFKQINDALRPPGRRQRAAPARHDPARGNSGRWTSWRDTAARSSSSCFPRPGQAGRASSPSASSGGSPTTTSAKPGRPVRVTISVGIACYPDERASEGESLLRLADANLYKAKADGRNRYRD